ncbi:MULTISPECIES: ABC transporter permease [Staphylococcus]|uniref:Iron chelate uptake ABC transporter family permease subunit n=1 Tax=Staphylococcus agnetis TaxID=985762 RepID=A0A2T4MIF8_9STAP|nr:MULTISPECIES: ABC transporter permease [Staphylococcus]NHM91659.1 ABC transporter permease [Staphylococcus sp. 10602379]NJI01345.1 iron chelate uptake ABC transporter family permease subunit [Staphylococcus agnetis]NJI12624.1 iron chelate uptake ABC transporter family permease subunit [Staphylococcus agnetis]PTH13753.1 iron ABC transporter permease [Staphylococcus agnetis]PTH29038.1 iron ABC transporter permease [Staphylococcus agnetis]
MRYFMNGYVLFFTLTILTVCSLFIGVSSVPITALFNLNDDQLNVLFASRIPRTVSILIAGSSLALAGLIMQQMMQNKFVSPTTAGTMEWAKLGILISLVFFPSEHILLKLLFAVLLSVAGTFLFVQMIQRIRFKDVIFVPLIGIMLGGIVSSFSTFIALKTNAVQSLGNWMNGNFAIITSGRYEILYLSLPLLVMTYLFANQFTIAGMGRDFSKNLGLNYDLIINIGLFITATITALVVVTVGTLPFLGLIVPNIVSIFKGDHLKNALPHTAMLGAIFVMFSDIVGRVVVYPYEINIGLTIGMFGTIIFIIMLMKGRRQYA